MKDIDILSFDAVADCEQGYDLELLDKDGVTPTGITVIVIGSKADSVQQWTSRMYTKMRQAEDLAKRKGQEVKIDLVELRAQNIDGAALRVTGWRGVKQTFDREMLKQALARNDHWVDQILEASNDLGNFGKRPRQNSLSLPDTSSA
jgi:hypothetical protein